MEKVFVVISTYVSDPTDYECYPVTKVECVCATEKLAQQAIAILEYKVVEEPLSLEEYTAECVANGYISTDVELDYCNYINMMHDPSQTDYHYEEWDVERE